MNCGQTQSTTFKGNKYDVILIKFIDYIRTYTARHRFLISCRPDYDRQSIVVTVPGGVFTQYFMFIEIKSLVAFFFDLLNLNWNK